MAFAPCVWGFAFFFQVMIFSFTAPTCIVGQGSNDPRVVTDEEDSGALVPDQMYRVLDNIDELTDSFVDPAGRTVRYYPAGAEVTGQYSEPNGALFVLTLSLMNAPEPEDNIRCEAAPPSVPRRIPLSGIQIRGVFRNMLYNVRDHLMVNLPGYFRAAFDFGGTMHVLDYVYFRGISLGLSSQGFRDSSSPALSMSRNYSHERPEDVDYFSLGCRSVIFTTLFGWWPHDTLLQGRSLYSPDGKVELRMQEDCNLVLYSSNWQHALWASLTYTKEPNVRCKLVLKLDGSAEVQRSNNGQDYYAVWKSGSECQGVGCKRPSFLSVQEDCNVVIYVIPTSPEFLPGAVWATGTRC